MVFSPKVHCRHTSSRRKPDEDKEDQREDQRLELVETVLYGVGESGEQAKQAIHREADEKSFGQRAEFAGQGAFREDGQGNVDLSGYPLPMYNIRWWHQRCGVVMQDGVIFSESIARNIAVSDGKINEERLMRAAEIACCKDFIMNLPLKFDTKIGRDGVGLSQGQKQRILIARAVYKDPDFIFLDEATNSLDAKNERQIVENLEQFYKGKTVLVVAHRLSTVKHADQIVVLDSGRVVEIGTHDELVSKRGTYYELVRNQLELGS